MKITAHTKTMNKTLVNIIAIVTALSLVFLQTPIFSFAVQARAEAAAEAAAQIEESGSVDVKFSFDHAYVMVDGQVLAPPASKVTIPADTNLVFSADADSGYEIDSVEATIGGSTTTLSPDGSGQYEVSASSLVDGKTSIKVKAISIPEPEPEVVEEEVVEEETVEQEAVEEEVVEDEAVEQEAVEDEAVESEAVEQEAPENEADGEKEAAVEEPSDAAADEAEATEQAADDQEVAEEATESADEAAEGEEAGLAAGAADKKEGEKAAATYEYSDSNVKVVATLSDPAALPEGVEFVVTPVTSKTNGYNYDAYMEALNKDAAEERTADNTLLYDVAFMLDGKEVALADGVANISFQFKDKQLTEELNASEASDVEVIHLPLTDAAKKDVDSTADAKDISAKDIAVEPIQSDTTLKGNTQKTEFATEGFSVYAMTVGTIAADETPVDSVAVSFEKASDSASGNGPSGNYEMLVVLNHSGKKYFVVSEALDTSARNSMVIPPIAFGEPYNNSSTATYAEGDTLEAFVVSNVDADWKVQKVMAGERDPYNYQMYGDGDVIDNAWRVSITVPADMAAPAQSGQGILTTQGTEAGQNEGNTAGAVENDDSAWDGGSSIGDLFNNYQGETPTPGNDTYDTILGNAINFGIVTENFNIVNDAETNVAAITADAPTGQWTGNDLTNDAEQTFILAHVTSQFYIKGFNTYVLTNTNDASKITFSTNENVIDTNRPTDQLESAIRNMLNYAKSQTTLLANRPDNTEITYGADQKYHVNLKDKPSGTYYVTVDGGLYSQMMSEASKLKIEKNADQTIVFNVTGNPDHIYQYDINNIAAANFAQNGEASSDMVRTIVWNFVNATNTITTYGGVAGIFLAPNATVKTGNGVGGGWLIAKNVSIEGAEWHNVDKRVRVLRVGSSVSFNANKQVDGVDSEVSGFEFELFYKNGQNWESLGTTTNTAASIAFDPVQYSGSNFTTTGNSQDYIYKIVEKQGAKTIDGTVYTPDTSVYYAKVTVNKVTKKVGSTTTISYNASAPAYYSDEACTKPVGALPTFNNRSEEQPELTSVSVRKVWDDANNQDGKRPGSVTVKLFANNTDTGKSAELKAGNNWSATWTDLPKKQDGADIAYTVQEVQVEGYEAPAITGNAADGFVVTNKRTPELVSIPAEKVWDDAKNQDGLRPTMVTLQLNKNGTEYKTVTVTAETSWKYTWQNLPKYENGKAITYTVSEPNVPAGYEASVDGYKVTNTHAPGKTSIKVTKNWVDGENQDGVRPDAITVKLLADGVEKETAELTKDNNWTHTWSNLDQKKDGTAIVYTVDEQGVTGYTKAISGDAANGFEITNTHETATTEISVTKAWNDNDNQDGIRPAQVSAQLYADGEPSGAAVVLNAGNNWAYTWTGLAKNKAGKAIKYTVKETPLNISLPEGVTAGYSADVTGSADKGFVITNTHEAEKTSVTATKSWQDNANQDGKRTNTAKLQLMANTGEGGQFVAVGDPVAVSKDDGFSHTWNNLAKFKDGNAITYKVVELDVPDGYESIITVSATNNFTVENKHNPGKTSVSVVKDWQDKNNEAGLRPSSVEVQLLANGTPTETVELNANNKWSYTWSGLDEYANGAKIDYTVQETTDVARYDDPVVTGSAAEGYTITNSYAPTYTQASVKKVWNDSENQDGARPESVQAVLYANGEVYQTATLNEGNEWSASWTDLPTVINGVDVVYTIDEPYVPTGYTKSVTNEGYAYEITNTHVTENTSVSVVKEWKDANDQDGLRANAAAMLQLMKAVGTEAPVAVGDPVAIGNDATWSYTWDDLPKYEAGQPITYSVVESGAPEGYSVNITKSNTTDGSFAFNISNDYAPGKTSVTVSKVWNDREDFDGLRPASVNVQLYADGKISGNPVQLNEGNGWTYTWNGLDEKAAGKTIAYSVAEVGTPTGYTVSTVRNESADNINYTITNTHSPVLTSASVQKVWNDGDNRDGLRPASIQVQLYANGVAYRDAVTLSQGNWSYEWNDLPTIIGGQNVKYTVGEIAIRSEYASSVSREGNAFTITNTYAPEETSISATKAWSDDENRDGIRADEVTVQLQVAGQPVSIEGVQATVKLNAKNNWTTTWSKLPKKAAGNDIAYEVVEVAAPVGYVPSYTTDAQGTVTVTNTHEPVKMSVSGEKTWNDNSNQDGKRPKSVTVRLHANNEEIASQTVRADNDGKWNYTFDNLYKYENGKEIVYTVTEDEVPGYTTAVNGFNVKNTHTPETIELSGTKTWDDADNQDGKRPESIEISLMNGETVVDTKTVTEADGWSYVFKNLPKYAGGSEITYTIAEKPVSGYNAPVVTGYNVKNSYETETTEVSGIKIWDDANDQDGIRPTSVKVNLMADGVKKESATVVADANGKWAYSFTELPKYKDGGTEIVYTVEEEPVDGYTTEISGTTITNKHVPDVTRRVVQKSWADEGNQDGIRPLSISVTLLADGEAYRTATLSEANGWNFVFADLPVKKEGKVITYTLREDSQPEDYTAAITELPLNVGFLVTNTHAPAKTSVSGKKTWNDNDDQDGMRPESITINLLANGTKVDSKVVTEEDNWAWEFEGLDKYANGQEIVYTVTEDAVEHYTNKIEGFDAINTHDVEKRSVKVAKIWNDSENYDGLRPANIQVRLYADGEPTDKVLTLGAPTWSAEFTGLDKYQSGQEIAYTVAEVSGNIPHYTIGNAEGDMTEGFSITNTHEVVKVSVAGKKTWDDASNQDGKRPASVVVNLLANGAKVKSQTLQGIGDEWSYQFDDLDKYTGDGREISYTVTEDAVTDYDTEIAGYNITNSYTPEKRNITVTKEWADAYNQDGMRPEKLKVKLLADNVQKDEITLPIDGQWSYTWSDLDRYAGGEEINYTLEEEPIEGYQASGNGGALVNTHIPETTSVSGKKTWNDNDDQDGMRPESITVHLLANGERVDSRIVTAANSWQYSFDELDVFANGERIAYTIEEDPVANYETTLNGNNITNTHTPETVSINGTKTWNDADNQDGLRKNVTVRLYADGVEIANKTVAAEDNWTYSFGELPKYKAGKVVDYKVEEDALRGYTVTYDGYNVENSHTPATTDVSGKKIWDDANNQDGLRPASITVNLMADGKKIDSQTVTPDERGAWTYAFNDLPKFAGGTEIAYTVTEGAVTDYDTEIVGYNITNSHTPVTTDVSGKKTWDDADNQDGKRPGAITVHLLANGAETELSKTVTAEDGWAWTFEGLDKYANGEEIVYTVSEEAVEGYSTTTDNYNVINSYTPGVVAVSGVKIWNDSNDQDGKRPESVTVRLHANGVEVDNQTVSAADEWKYEFTGLPEYEGGQKIVYTVTEDAVNEYDTEIGVSSITNTHVPETVDLAGEKTWDDKDNRDGKRPESITVRLLANDDEVASKVVTEEDNWAWEFKGLDKYANGEEIVYTVSEDEVTGYTSEVDGMNVTNTHTPEKTSVSGKKTWSDNDNQDGKRPESITVHLLANGAETELSETVTAEDGWAWTFENLGKYVDGEEIVYTVSEDEVTGYTSEVDGMNVTNTHTPEKTSVSGKKTWSDNDNQDGKRPESITVHLLANGAETELSETVTAEDGWAWTFEGLDKYANGKEIVYTVSEDAVEHYSTELHGMDVTNSYTPSKTSLNGTKEWVDNGDQDGRRPSEITVHLLKNGDDTGTTAKATAANNWQYSFTDLDEYEAGKPIEYTVAEDEVAGYESEVNGGNVKNTLETGSLLVKKTVVNATIGGAEFDFTVKLDDAKVNGTHGDLEFKDGVANFKLSNGGSVLATDLPAGVGYTVTEQAKDGYTASYTGETGTIPVNAQAQVAVTNTYNATATVQFKALKTLALKTQTNRALGPDEFTFELLKGDKVIDTKKNGGLGNVSFDEITYTLADVGETYDYTIREVAPKDAVETKDGFVFEGVTYDLTEHPFTVSVSDNGNGTLNVDYDGYDPEAGVAITNTYQSKGTVELRASKTLAGAKPGNGQFSFQLWERQLDKESGETVWAPKGDPVACNAEGEVAFPAFELATPEARLYLITEVVPEEAVLMGDTWVYKNVAYGSGAYKASEAAEALNTDAENTARKVTVTGKDNFNGTIAFTPEYEDGEQATFENATVAPAQFTLGATKVMAGRDFKAAAGDSFTFKLEGSVVRGETSATVPMPHDAADPKKIVDEVTITPTEGAEAAIDFGTITFTTDDLYNTYRYTVSEEGLALNDGVGVMSDVAHTVDVTIVSADDGTIGVQETYDAELENDASSMVFTNRYFAKGNTTLQVNKTLTGRDLLANEFSFAAELEKVTASNGDDVAIDEDTHAQTVASPYADEKGVATFELTGFTQEDIGKTFTYKITEEKGEKPGVTYDESVYYADVTVKDSEKSDGTLEFDKSFYKLAPSEAEGQETERTPVEAATFANAYTAESTYADLEATKLLANGELAEGQFTFTLVGTSENTANVKQTASNDENGKVAFDRIEYDKAGTYEYAITEDIPANAVDNGDGTWKLGTVVYDGTTHRVTVTVTDETTLGKLVATVAYDDGKPALTITNGIQLAHAGLVFDKYCFGGTGVFNFVLAAANADGTVKTDNPVEFAEGADVIDSGTSAFKLTVQNGTFASGKAEVVFPEISYAADGDYYYLVYEDEQDTAEMVVDKVKYLVHVKVENAEAAEPVYTYSYDGADFRDTNDHSFYNNSAVKLGFNSLSAQSYTDQAERVSVYPKAKKLLVGADKTANTLLGGDFQFELIDKATGKVIATATNDENGVVAFFDENVDPGLAYDAPGVYKYAMRELAGDVAGITYDSSEIELTVNVVQTDDGLVAEMTNSQNAEIPTFTNIKEGMDVTVQKVSRSGGEGLAGSTYALWMVGANGDVMIQEATSDASGYITFKDVNLVKGQKYYFKEVSAPSGHTVDPYRTAYFALDDAGTALVLAEKTAADGWHSATESTATDSSATESTATDSDGMSEAK